MSVGNEILNQVKQKGKDMLKEAGKNIARMILTSPIFYIVLAICALILVIAGAFAADADINEDVEEGYTNVGNSDFYGQALVDIAKGLHDYIRENQYAYSCSCNVSGGYANSCTDCSSCGKCNGISNFGKNNFDQYDNIKCIDCSAYVSWVLNQYLGIDNFHTRRTSHWFAEESNWNSSTSYGWEKVDINDIQAGDILWKNGHVGIYIGDGKTVEAGSTRAIRAENSYGSLQTVIDSYTFGIRIH